MTTAIGKRLQRYWGLMNVSLQQSMSYRFAFFTAFLADIIKTGVMLAVWMAVYRQRSTIAGFDYPMMITYLLVSQAINNVYGFHNDAERTISKKISQGTIGFDLLKPVSFTTARLAENLGQTLLQVLFAALMLLGFSCFVPELSGPASGVFGLLFLVSAAAGFFTMFAVSIMSGLLSFWLMSNWGLRNAKNAIISFLSGSLMPLSILPGWMQAAANILPFKNIVYTPVMIYMGQYTLPDALIQIGLQLIWAAALWLIAKGLFAWAIRRVSINGG